MSDMRWTRDAGQQRETHPNAPDRQVQTQAFLSRRAMGLPTSLLDVGPNVPTYQYNGAPIPVEVPVETDSRQFQWNIDANLLLLIRNDTSNWQEFARAAHLLLEKELTSELERSGQVSLDTPEQRRSEWQELENSSHTLEEFPHQR